MASLTSADDFLDKLKARARGRQSGDDASNRIKGFRDQQAEAQSDMGRGDVEDDELDDTGWRLRLPMNP